MIKKSEQDALPEEDKLNLDDDIVFDSNLIDNLEVESDDNELSSGSSTRSKSKNISSAKKSDPVPKSAKKAGSTTKTTAKSNEEDAELEVAINDIAARDMDTILVTEDAVRSSLDLPPKTVDQKGLKGFIRSLWVNPGRRWAVISFLFLSIAGLATIPTTRYFILNTAGVRASVELRVIDSTTLQPLKNVNVKIVNTESKTDGEGNVKLDGVKLGGSNLRIEKRAFALKEESIVVGWGSNPLGEYSVEPIGSQYTFYARDFLSKKPLAKVEAVSDGDGHAISDEEGKIVLVLDTANMDDSATFDVTISYDDYRTEELTVAVSNRESQSVDMVPRKQHVFVSKRSGKYDVYAIHADGKNERKVLEGSGFERSDILISQHPIRNMVAYVSSRENVRNQSGYLLNTAYIIDLDKDDVVRFDQSEQIKLIGWTDNDRLVYAKKAAGTSGTSPDRHRLMSLSVDQSFLEGVTELASSNYFNDVTMVGDTVYYAPSNIFNEDPSPATYSIKADGKDKQTIVDKETFEIIRTSYDTLFFDTNKEWYEHSISLSSTTKSSPPGVQSTRLYTDFTADKFSLWLDNRDGKGVLLSYDISTAHEKIIVERGGLKYPVYWLNADSVVYRVADGRETADYVVNVVSGESVKIVDTTDTKGISGWLR